MGYLAIKHAHIGFVGISITLFVLRGLLQGVDIDWRRWRLLKILPHVNDTLLLGAAIWLAVTSHQYPFVAGWLTAKVFGLLAYIGFGMLALRRNRPQRANPPMPKAKRNCKMPKLKSNLCALSFLPALCACASNPPAPTPQTVQLAPIPAWIQSGRPSKQQVRQELNSIFSTSVSTP